MIISGGSVPSWERMIRRGRDEGWLKLPLSALDSYASFNAMNFCKLRFISIDNKGSALVASCAVGQGHEDGPLLVVPKDLMLTRDHVQLHSRSDRHLREVLDAIGDLGKVDPTPPGVHFELAGNSSLAVDKSIHPHLLTRSSYP